MPIFEFECSDCKNDFEELLRSASALDQVVCPQCGSRQVKKKISNFASKISAIGGGSSSFSGGSCSPAGA